MVSAELLNCHCQAAEFLLHTKKMTRSKFRASKMFLKRGEYAVTRKEHFSFLA
jgi:hypothetical protein